MNAHFETILSISRGRWDEAEISNLSSFCRTLVSFLLGTAYRYKPVSALYMYGRKQDFTLQRTRDSFGRLYIRLWMTKFRYEDKPVWIGQISRVIGMSWDKIVPHHNIDPYVDDARNYLMSDVFEMRYLDRTGLVGGVGVSTRENPRRNLHNDPYVTDGNRAVIILSPTKTQGGILSWEEDTQH